MLLSNPSPPPAPTERGGLEGGPLTEILPLAVDIQGKGSPLHIQGKGCRRHPGQRLGLEQKQRQKDKKKREAKAKVGGCTAGVGMNKRSRPSPKFVACAERNSKKITVVLCASPSAASLISRINLTFRGCLRCNSHSSHDFCSYYSQNIYIYIFIRVNLLYRATYFWV